MTAITECPWPATQVRVMVKNTLRQVGGVRGFEFLGRRVQEAVIAQAAWDAVRTAAMLGPVSITSDGMSSIERAFMAAAGMSADDGDPT